MQIIVRMDVTELQLRMFNLCVSSFKIDAEALQAGAPGWAQLDALFERITTGDYQGEYPQ